MKRHISVLACLLMLVAIVFAVASCTKPEESHVHKYESSVTKEATCTENGEETFACKCGDVYVNEIEATGHPKDAVVEIPAVAPTCTETGKAAGKKCSACDAILVAQSTLAATGHTPDVDKADTESCVPATFCVNEGCDKVFVAAVEHDVTLTCREGDTCANCGEYVEALGHKAEDDVCTVCGHNVIVVTTTETYDMYMTDEYTFTAAESGKYTFYVPAGLGLFIDGDRAPKIDFYDNTNGYEFTIELPKDKEITYFVAATSKGDWTLDWSFVACEVEDDDDTPVTSVKDANGLGGEYTFTFVMTYTLTFTPNSEGATVGMLVVDDPINPQYSGTYSYTIVDGDYVFTSADVSITKDMGGNWYFRNAGIIQPQMFAEATSSGDSGSINYDTVIVAGSNTLYFSEEEMTAGTADRALTITVAGDYKFVASLFISSITDANGTPIAMNDDYTYTLAAGEYTVTFGMFSMLNVPANVAQKLNVVSNSVTGGGDEEEVDITGTYLGTDSYGNQTLTVTIDADTVTFTYSHPTQGTSTATYDYAVVDGAVVLYGEDGTVLDARYGSVTLTDGVPTAANYGGNDYTLVEGEPSGGDDDDSNEGDGSYEAPYVIESFPYTSEDVFLEYYGSVYYTFTATADGYITVTANGEGLDSLVINDNHVSTLKYAVLANKTYTICIFLESEGAVSFDLSVAFEAATLTADDYKGIISGTTAYTADSAWSVYFGKSDSGVYYANVNGGSWDAPIDYYYSYSIVFNADGTISIAPIALVAGMETTGSEYVLANNYTLLLTPGEYGYTLTFVE